MEENSQTNSAEWCFNQGCLLFQAGNDNQARDYLLRSVELEPNNANAHAALSQIFTKHGNQNDALKHFNLAIDLAPQLVTSDVHFNLAKMHLQQGQYEKASKCCESALLVGARDESIQVQVAQFYLEAGDWDKSEELLQTLLTANPKLAEHNPQLHVDFSLPSRLAELRSRAFDLRDQIKKSIELFPNLQVTKDEAFYEACLLADRGRVRLAIGKLRDIISSKPDHCAALYCLSLMLSQHAMNAPGSLELLTEANKYLNQVIKLMPSFVAAYALFGGIAFQIMIREGSLMSQGDSVIGFLKQALQIDPKCPEVYNHIFTILYQQGRMLESFPYMEKCVLLEDSVRSKHPLADQQLYLNEVSYAIGHFAESLEVLVKMEKLGMSPKRTKVIFAPPGRVSNPCLLDYWREHYVVISDPKQIEAMRPLASQLRYRANWPILPGNRVHLQRFAKGIVQAEWDARGLGPLLTLTDQHRAKGWAVLNKLGVPSGAWFVGMHVREGTFKREGTGAGYNSRRNADVLSYVEAIKAITDRGGWVIRLGEAGMKPLPALPNVIDYALSEYKSDWMDIFLCGAARFFLTTSAGVTETPPLFGVPLVATNYDGPCRSYSANDVFIFKNIRLAKENRYLNFKELHQPPVFNGIRGEYFAEIGIEFVDNSPDEIRCAVIEMMDKLDGVLVYSADEDRRQELFAALLPEQLGKFTCRVARDFLKKYEQLMPN